MDWILLILIVSFLVYALAYRIGVVRGRKESRIREYRHGYRKGYEQAKEDISGLFQLEDQKLLARIRELRKIYTSTQHSVQKAGGGTASTAGKNDQAGFFETGTGIAPGSDLTGRSRIARF